MQKDEEEEVAGNADDGMLEKRYADRDESGIVVSAAAVAADREKGNCACAVSTAAAAAIIVVANMGIGVGLVSTPPG